MQQTRKCFPLWKQKLKSFNRPENNCNLTTLHLIVSYQCTLKFISSFVPKLATPLASNTLNSVWSSWISTKYRTLHYLNITYCHTYYDIRTLMYVLSVTSLWHKSLQTVLWVGTNLTSVKAIKQWRTTRLRAASRPKVATLSTNFKD